MIRPFLFGKLPASGDFVSRGLSGALRQWWDERCCATMADGVFGVRQGPIRFLVEPMNACAARQAGCMLPSRDRVGRRFPLVLGLLSDSPIGEEAGAAIAGRLAFCGAGTIERRDPADTLLRAAMAAWNDAAAPALGTILHRMET